MKTDLNKLAKLIHDTNCLRWEVDPTGEPIKPHTNTMTWLIATELMAARHGRQYPEETDRRLPHRSLESVCLADCLIRLLDYCGGFDIDLNGAFWEKLEYNKTLTEGELVWGTGRLDEPD